MIRTFPLILCAVVAGGAPASTEPVRGDELALLKQHYLVCDRHARHRRMSGDEAAACSVVAERLLQRAFGADLEHLLAWWRVRQAPSAEPAALFEQAQSHYETGHYAEAWTLFARLADCGHVESARIALQMQRLGLSLYGMQFTAEPGQLQRWRAALMKPDAQQFAAPCTAPAHAGRDNGQPAAARTSDRRVAAQVRADI